MQATRKARGRSSSGAAGAVAVRKGRLLLEFFPRAGRGATTITVAIKKHYGTAGTSQNVDWHVSG